MNDSSSSNAGCCPKAAHLRTLIDEISRLLPGHAEELSARKGPCLATESGCQVKAAADAAMAVATDAKDSVIAGGQKAVETVRKYPVQAAAIAVVGTGLLVWWLATRNQDKE